MWKGALTSGNKGGYSDLPSSGSYKDPNRITRRSADAVGVPLEQLRAQLSEKLTGNVSDKARNAIQGLIMHGEETGRDNADPTEAELLLSDAQKSLRELGILPEKGPSLEQLAKGITLDIGGEARLVGRAGDWTVEIDRTSVPSPGAYGESEPWNWLVVKKNGNTVVMLNEDKKIVESNGTDGEVREALTVAAQWQK